MRILHPLTIAMISLAALSGAAHAEIHFPAGKAGQNSFELFPRWQRVLIDAAPKPVDHAISPVSPARDEHLPGPIAATINATSSAARVSVSWTPPSPAAHRISTTYVAPDSRPTREAPQFETSPGQRHARVAPDCHLTNDCTVKDWQALLASGQSLPRHEQLELVHAWANKVQYVEDITNWAMADYWQTTDEFFARGGDCEDYAITKYFGLKQLGFVAEDMRILVLFDKQLQLHHAVLLVNLDGKVWMLDNQKSSAVLFSDAEHYRPIYSINEQNWWIHKTPQPARFVVTKPTRMSARTNTVRRFR